MSPAEQGGTGAPAEQPSDKEAPRIRDYWCPSCTMFVLRGCNTCDFCHGPVVKKARTKQGG